MCKVRKYLRKGENAMGTNSVFTISYWDNKRITLAAFLAAQKGSYIRK